MGNGRTPSSIPILDRPLLQHIVESLVTRGIREFYVSAFISVDRTNSLLQDGTRWGAKVTVEGSRNWPEILQNAKTFANGESLLVANAERLPDLAEIALDEPGILVAEGGPIGWGVLATDELALLPNIIAGERVSELPPILVTNYLSSSHPNDLATSWSLVLSKKMPLLVQTGREKSPGVVIGRGAKVDASAQLVAPAYIGENVVVGKGCEIGPDGYVGSNSIVETGSRVTNTVVLPSTYVGAHLELVNKVACRSSVWDIARGVAVPIADEFLLGSTKLDRTNAPPIKERLAAAIASILLLPFVIIGAVLSRGQPLSNGEIGYQSPTKDFFFRFIPGLLSVLTGSARIVGAPYLPPSVMQRLEPEVRRVLAGQPRGLVSETYLLFGPSPSEDDLWASSAFVAVGKGQVQTGEVLSTYLKLALGGKKPDWQSQNG